MADTSGSSSSPSSSSSSSRILFSRSISGRSDQACAICLGSLRTGQGRAIFTAECSHSFHFSCITTSIKHGNRLCPICRSKWTDLPFQGPIDPGLHSPAADIYFHLSSNLGTRSPFHPDPQHFSDDEPLALPHTPTPPLHHGTVIIKALPEYLALGSSESSPSFAVLVSVQAPPLHCDSFRVECAPVDLVTVLDVSASMTGTKLALLKRAVCFVADSLGPSDRLSIVAFSSAARRMSPLRRMTDEGRRDASVTINSLSASSGTNILQGLVKGVQVLEDRREKNPVASIMLLSDGRDTFNLGEVNQLHPGQVPPYLHLLPPSISISRETQNDDQNWIVPVHAFGFGMDHDSAALHAISNASGGTFSFIESLGTVQDGLARCIGGLLSVVAQQLRIMVTPASDKARIISIPSGRYCSEVNDEGNRGVINVGELYADEEKEFLVYLSILPEASVSESEVKERKTPLLDVMCTYKEPVSKETIDMGILRVEISRPELLSSMDRSVSLVVDRQRNRVLVAEDIARAQGMAEMGNIESAKALLEERRSTLSSSASSQAGDIVCSMLEAELREIRERMVSKELYEHAGRAYVLSGMSAHSWQRATTRGNWSSAPSVVVTRSMSYETPNMVKMVRKSQTLNLRELEQAGESSKTGSFSG